MCAHENMPVETFLTRLLGVTDLVIAVKQATEKHQLLYVVGNATDNTQLAHVVKVVNRAVVSNTVMRAQLNWLYMGHNSDGYVETTSCSH